jgi:hypothetical protein
MVRARAPLLTLIRRKLVAAMIETRKRSAQRHMKTILGLWALGSLCAMAGCSSSDAPAETGLGTGGGAGTGGGGNAMCGMSVNDPSKYPACSSCTGGRCVPKSIVTTPGVAELLAPCQDTSQVCVPDNIVSQGENLKLTSCKSIGDGEGRCASTCIGVVAALQAYLPAAGCGANERCAPCFNPATGQPTGLCGLGCDDKPTGAPVKFGTCCGSDGLCAPKAALGSLGDQLGAESCTNASDVCVPAKPITTPGSRFKCCTGGGMNGTATYSGACVSACVINAGPLKDQIPQGDCGSTEVCVPCANPTVTPPTATGVCTDATGQSVTTCAP